MAEERATILDIDIDVDKTMSKITTLRKRSAELKEEQKELRKEGKEGTKQFSQNAVELKNLNAQIRKNEKTLTDYTALQNSNGNSIEMLRKKLSLQTAQWNALSKEQRESTEVGEKLQASIKETSDELKELEGSVGDTRRNVGNYKEDMKGAIQESGLYAAAQEKLALAQAGYTTAVQAASAATRSFKAVLISSGIGAIVVAIGSLIGLLATLRGSIARNEESQAKLNKIMGFFRGVLNGLMEFLEPLADHLLDNVAKGFDLLANAAKKASGLVQRALEFFGFDEAAQKLADFENQVGETVRAQQKLAMAEQELAEIRREQDKTQLEYQKNAERLRQIRDNTDKSTQERIEANRKLGDLLDEQLDKELAMAKKSLEIAQLRVKAEGETKENMDAVAEAETKIAEIEERITTQRSEQVRESQRLREEAAKKAQDAIENEQEKRKKNEEQAAKEADKAAKEEISRQEKLEAAARRATEAVKDEYQKRTIALKEQLAAGKISQKEFEKEKADLQLASLKMQKSALEAHGQKTLNIEERIADAKIGIKKREMEKQRKFSEQEQQQLKKSLDGLANLFGEQTEAYKFIRATQAIIDTFSAATAALAGPPTGAGPILGIPVAANAIATGLANVNKIRKQDTKSKFEEGGTFEVGGRSHSEGGTKFYGDDGSSFEAEQGELITVVNKNSTGMLKNLSSINEAGGGAKFAGSTSFARDGGIIRRSANNSPTERPQVQKPAQDRVQIVTKVTDLDRVRERQELVNDFTELG